MPLEWYKQERNFGYDIRGNEVAQKLQDSKTFASHQKMASIESSIKTRTPIGGER